MSPTALGALLLAGCGVAPPPARVDHAGPAADPAKGVFFVEVTSQSGISPGGEYWPDDHKFLVPSINPGGLALLDFDGDGLLDILQTCHPAPDLPEDPSPKRLYRQQADASFTLVANAGGLDDTAFAQGVAVGDYDNDGYSDVYFCNYGRDALYRNNGDGTFSNATQSSGISLQPNWSTAASFADYDRDGHLDLMVVHYLKYDPQLVCTEQEKRAYCGPQKFGGLRATLYHNNQDGTFSDVTEQARLKAPGKGLGLLCADLSGDGWVDFFVANDGQTNFLWINQHDGTFREEGTLRGCAVNGIGVTEANMGVAVGDVAGNGLLSLFVTHQARETNALYLAEPDGMFRYASAQAGMAAVDLPYTGWGTGFLDVDNDGDLDVAVVNGRISPSKAATGADCGPFWNEYAERNLLFVNTGDAHFQSAARQSGDFTKHVEVTRGLALGDIDNDGRIDLVSNAVDNTLRVYRNVCENPNHWLTVRALVGARDALGAEVRLITHDRPLVGVVIAGYSSGCSSDPRVHFGLGQSAPTAVEIRWPDGSLERFAIDAVDRQWNLRQGDGLPPEQTKATALQY